MDAIQSVADKILSQELKSDAKGDVPGETTAINGDQDATKQKVCICNLHNTHSTHTTPGVCMNSLSKVSDSWAQIRPYHLMCHISVLKHSIYILQLVL